MTLWDRMLGMEWYLWLGLALGAWIAYTLIVIIIATVVEGVRDYGWRPLARFALWLAPAVLVYLWLRH